MDPRGTAGGRVHRGSLADFETYAATLGVLVDKAQRGGSRVVVFDAPVPPGDVERSFRAGCGVALGA